MSFLDSKALKRKDRQLLFEYVDEQLSQIQDFLFYDPQTAVTDRISDVAP